MPKENYTKELKYEDYYVPTISGRILYRKCEKLKQRSGNQSIADEGG